MKNLYYVFIILLLTGCAEINSEVKLASVSNKLQEGDAEGAKSDLLNYLESGEIIENDMSLTILGHIHEDLDEDSLAQIAYVKAIKLNNKYAEAVTGLGILARKRGDYKDAITFYERAVTINPDYAQAHSSLSVVYLLERNFEKSIETGELAWKLDDTDPVIAANLTIAYHYVGDSLNRDKFYRASEELEYRNLETLEAIFRGESTVF